MIDSLVENQTAAFRVIPANPEWLGQAMESGSFGEL
jgi:hypothetical protein